MFRVDRKDVIPPIVYDAFYESFYFQGRPVTDLPNLVKELATQEVSCINIQIVSRGAKGAVPVSEQVKQHINVALASLQSVQPNARLRAY